MIENNTLLDNSTDELRMVYAVRDLIVNEKCTTVKIATGYWDIPGTALVLSALKTFLQRPDARLQLLIGTDPVVRASQQKSPKYKGAHSQTDFIRCDLQSLEVRDEYVDVVQTLKEHCLEHFDTSRIQIKMCKADSDGHAQFFHAKCYIFLGSNFAKGIVGSSNFTQKGLEENSELNYLEWDNARVTAVPNQNSSSKGHDFWFEEKWKQAEEWNKTFLEEVLKGSPVEEEASKRTASAPLTPYELYIKLLAYKFGDIVDLNQQKLIESYLPARFTALEYQVQAVKQCFAIMHEHGGFMLGDVVGLGKTIVGALIIKHFLTLPDNDGRERRVLIVTPPAIKSAWVETIEEFDAEAPEKMKPLVDFVTTGSIGHLIDDPSLDVDDETGDFESSLETKNYGLILIDESHRFRNNGTNMYKALDALISTIGLSTGRYPFIGLLSATLQNNRPADLQNQIYLFQRNHKASSLRKAEGGDLERFFSAVNKEYQELISIPKDDDGRLVVLTKEQKTKRHEALKRLSETIRTCILEDILVRRTRTDIIKYYGNAFSFPTISGPHPLVYTMDDDLADLFAKTMEIIAPDLDFETFGSQYLLYFRYRAIEFFLDPATKNLYKAGNVSPDLLSRQLAKIMQTNLVKRLESSFSAFKSSLQNLLQYTQNMIDMWDADSIFICPDIDVNAELKRDKKYDKSGLMLSFQQCADDIRKKIDRLNLQGKNDDRRNREYRREDFNPDYRAHLERDLNLLSYLCTKWNAISYDPKLEAFKRSLQSDLFDAERNPSQKLVVFSEAVDTVRAICGAIKAVAPRRRVLVVTSANRHEAEQTIRENFDANFSGEQKDDYQIIVTTEVLAEGINLHRANTIVNYDTPWNATRLMQRIGRVNRIGSTARTVYVYNFFPSAQGDAHIQLVQKAHVKLQSFHTLFGEDSQIFSLDEEVTQYDLNKQVNGDESPMEQYINELKAFKTAHPQRYAELLALDDGLHLAAPTAIDASLFLVRNDVLSLFVKVDAALHASILSGADMYALFRTDPKTPAVPLPADWDKRRKEAVLAVNQVFSRLNINTRNSEKATQAKEIIQNMWEAPTLSSESRTVLKNAKRFVEKGNVDIINRILSIDREINSRQLSFLALSQEDIDDILNREIKKIVDNVQKHFGEPKAYLSLTK